MALKSKLAYLFPPYNLSSHDKNEVHALITHLASLLIGSFAQQWLHHFFSSAIRMTGWKDKSGQLDRQKTPETADSSINQPEVFKKSINWISVRVFEQ